MPTLLTCPLGHQWEIKVDGQSQRGDGHAVCPTCNAAIDLPASDSNRWVVTNSGTVVLMPEIPEVLPAAETPSDLRADTPANLEALTVEANPRPTDHDPEATLPPPDETAATPRSLAEVAVPGYEIIGELGRGGMGVVYKARQTKLKRLVALKMILSGVHASPKELRRFHAEAEAVARLQHPNIVQIYEVGEHQQRPFFSLEYVGGGSLSQKYHGQVVAPRLAADMIQTVARAVHYAHQQGVIHRDLKPANILLQLDERRDDDPRSQSVIRHAPSVVLKITDFGLAKQLGRDISNTQTGAVMGTANYMAPEQAWGKAKEVGPAADIYSLGAILYELLTGRPPFVGETPMDTMLRVMSDEPMPPSKLRSGLPRDLETICLKCLNKLPAGRYASAQALADDIQRYLENRPIHARPIGRIGRMYKWARRHPIMASFVGGVAFVACLTIFIWATAHERQREAARRRAVQLAPRAQEILHKYCYECHGQDHENIKKLDVFDDGQLFDAKRRMIVRGHPDDSRLIQRIVDESMPPPDAEEMPRVSQAELNVLREWIAGGAPPFPQRELQPEPDPTGEAAILAAEVKRLFTDYCWSCHRVGKADSGIKILNHDLLVNKRRVVVPGQPDRSELYELLVTKDETRLMPPPKIKQRPDEAEIETIRRWIAIGAPALPRTKGTD
jgi:mono/diheme cytochrome c family protein/tRNA A-37 threonylcarbamoyl transferase component Bud32